MQDVTTIIQTLAALPLGHLAIFVALAGIALAAFAIHAATKERR